VREIRIHDTLTNAPRPLEPRDPGKVGIYACGPTVYGRIHVGNARPFVVFSLLKRFLEHEGYEAALVVNVTDVNDKIYAAAEDRGVGSQELAREMTAAYLSDTDRLGLGRPDAEPKAAETIGPIVSAAFGPASGRPSWRPFVSDTYASVISRASSSDGIPRSSAAA
jgi:cysteinyl-tRNA synthetase